jgi:hypothetical protein
MHHDFTIDPTDAGGAQIAINGTTVMTIEPLGTAEQPPVGATKAGQHFIASMHHGPDAGRQVRIDPCPKGLVEFVTLRRVRYA